MAKRSNLLLNLKKKSATDILGSLPLAWYDASDDSYLTLSGAAITQMLDRSGNGNHTDVQSTGTKRPQKDAVSTLNSLQTSSWDGGDTLKLPSALNVLANANQTVFAVAKQPASALDMIYCATESGSPRNVLRFNNSTDIGYRCNTSTANSVANTADSTKYQMMYGRRESTTQALSVAGNTEVTNASGASESGIDASYIGSENDTQFYITGNIVELIFFNRNLSVAEILHIELYLANKYGLYHPNATWITAFESEQQQYIHALKLNKDNAFTAASPFAGWYKADEDYLELSATKVLYYKDAGGRGNNTVTQGTSTKRPTFDAAGYDGAGRCVYDGGDAFFLPAALEALPNGNSTVFFVAQSTTSGGVEQRLITGYNQAYSTKYLFNYLASDDAVNCIFVKGSGVGAAISIPLTITDLNVITGGLRDTTEEFMSVNGGAESTNAGGEFNDEIRDMSICAYGDTALFFEGYIGEFLFFDKQLTDDEITNVQVILADKYGTYHPDAAWILDYDADQQEQIHAIKMNRSQAFTNDASNPLLLWIRPSDESTVTKPANKISRINDKGGLENDLIQATGTKQATWTASGLGSEAEMTFDGSSDCYPVDSLSSLATQPFSFFGVLSVAASTADYPTIISWNNLSGSPDNAMLITINSLGQLITSNNVGSLILTPGEDYRGQDILVSITYDGTDTTAWINGVEKVTGAIAYVSADKCSVGCELDSGVEGNWYKDTISELILVNRALSDVDRQAEELILTNRYLTP